MSWPENTPDRALLAAFTSQRDEGAFEVLVRRHGGMVLEACRSVLAGGLDGR